MYVKYDYIQKSVRCTDLSKHIASFWYRWLLVCYYFYHSSITGGKKCMYIYVDGTGSNIFIQALNTRIEVIIDDLNLLVLNLIFVRVGHKLKYFCTCWSLFKTSLTSSMA